MASVYKPKPKVIVVTLISAGAAIESLTIFELA
jgi:hypothetical protein